jgi:tetratricopeptide (TPR) repeat protein
MKNFFCLTIIIVCFFNFNLCLAIEPPDIIKDHVANKKLSQTTIEDLKANIKKNPNDISAYKDLIKLQENAGLNSEAIDSYLMLALIYENLKMFDQAKICYKSALKLDPESELLQNKSKIVYAADTPAKSNYYQQTTAEKVQTNKPNFGNNSQSAPIKHHKESFGKLTQQQVHTVIQNSGTSEAGRKFADDIIDAYQEQIKEKNNQ